MTVQIRLYNYSKIIVSCARDVLQPTNISRLWLDFIAFNIEKVCDALDSLAVSQSLPYYNSESAANRGYPVRLNSIFLYVKRYCGFNTMIVWLFYILYNPSFIYWTVKNTFLYVICKTLYMYYVLCIKAS